ncbi:hypothetical protein D5018_08015 [Parashewanella curva]|uniref:Uncharacterized protein n=1 Tax=Parashewanella curva TaxID=2338552 RepID=A0A3L8Q1L8_9GAMM|nr:hypothetical protein [Parashewanella curva]RLV60202.1 hypothetical protein D5018_08015 [Parashewanella curva]
MSQLTDKQLDDLINGLPEEMSVSPNVWQKVQGEISHQPKPNSSKWVPMTLVASLLLTAVLSWKLFDHQSLLSVPEHNTNTAMLALIDNVEQNHQQQVSQLQQTIKRVAWQQVPEFSPFKKGLKELRQAMQEVINQLKLQPQDKQLWDLWLWMQQQELNLLGQEQRVQQIESI